MYLTNVHHVQYTRIRLYSSQFLDTARKMFVGSTVANSPTRIGHACRHKVYLLCGIFAELDTQASLV